MCPRTEKLRLFLLGLGVGLLLSFLVGTWLWKLLLAAGLIVGGISCILSRALFAALPKQAGQQRRGSPFQK